MVLHSSTSAKVTPAKVGTNAKHRGGSPQKTAMNAFQASLQSKPQLPQAEIFQKTAIKNQYEAHVHKKPDVPTPQIFQQQQIAPVNKNAFTAAKPQRVHKHYPNMYKAVKELNKLKPKRPVNLFMAAAASSKR